MRKALLFSTLAVIVGLGLAFYYPRQPLPVPTDSQSPPVPATQPPAVMIPHMDQIMAQMARDPTPKELEEEARVDAEQVQQAEQWLNKPDAKDRLSGVEQLAAYPTSEAESLLVAMLNTDIDAAVRSAAAQGLDGFEKLKGRTIDALLVALGDPSPEVRASVLSTLEDQVSKAKDGSARYKKIVAGLKKAAASRHVAKETREEIRELLQDLAF